MPVRQSISTGPMIPGRTSREPTEERPGGLATVAIVICATIAAGVQPRSDHCAGSAGANGIPAPDDAVYFATTDELIEYLRSQGVDVPDGAYDLGADVGGTSAPR
ncbi:hypothetical protein [Nakamurella leprariae]|uniref:Uncharacterized protein n=1 Tax=Nakamurella leprariae TaxID=2803911 RepID=A0A939BY91_9ACTN|nr:hypothetical protein [Nakamurella leprariae]MBM9466376.1 hypothetical protein [Nakamurella leprariae]